MKRYVIAAMLAVGLVGISYGADEPAKPASGPKIQFDKMIYDFGTTSLVTKLTGTIVISNTGDAPLENLHAQPSCGCTSAPLKTNKLAPGEKTDLTFTVNVGAMNRGHLEKHITITSNDSKQPSVALTLKADIVSVYEYTPQAIIVGDIHIGATTNIAVQIKRTDGKPLGLTKAEGFSQLLQAKLDVKAGPPETATVNVEVKAEGAARRFNDSVRVFGENPTQPLFMIPVGGRIVGDLALSQEMLFWGVADPANWPGPRGVTATTRKIIVTSNLPDQKLELTNLTSSIPGLNVTLKSVTDGKVYELVAVLDKLPAESTTGTIKFNTNLKSQESVEVRVTINILKRS